MLVAFLCVLVFALVVGSVFFDWPAKDLNVGVEASVLVFGSLLFLIAGLYLPEVLKLKVGGIELEKSAPEQVTTTALRITGEARLIARLPWSASDLLRTRQRRASAADSVPTPPTRVGAVVGKKHAPAKPSGADRKKSGEIPVVPKPTDYRGQSPADA